MNKNTANLILEKVASDYDSIADRFSQTRYRDWDEFYDFEKYLKTGLSVLDVGCGNGRLLNFLTKYGISYVGIDASAKLIQIAKKIADEKITSSLSSYSFLKASATELPFADQSFHIVFAVASLYHIPSHELRNQAVKEIARVLKPSGIFIMTYWNMWEKSRRQLVAKNVLKKVIGKSKLDFFDTEKPWKNPDGEVVVNRYCHAFRLGEIEKMAKNNHIRTVEKYYMKKGRQVKSNIGFNGVYIGKKC
ncbi:MAG: class I SAM-dependent methyltransferase [Patescibacteria group bacterium]|jgi:ubiquinone/menaquinone biosynthesis C-methylase UbiE